MKSILKKISSVLLILLTLVTLTITILFTYFWQTTEIIDLEKLNVENNTILYDLNQTELAHMGLTYHQRISYDDLPEHMIWAIISVEDARFFDHKGVDYRGIMRAIVSNLQNKNYSEGASTITQQLIKNVYLSTEKSLERKVNEALMAIKLEMILTKEQILEAYLNNVLFGGKIYGIQMAAKYYFNKNISDITLIEAATLAAIVQTPNKLNPFNNPIDCEQRRNTVLERMNSEGYITDEALERLKITSVESYLNHGKIADDVSIFSSYLDYVYDILYENNTNLYSDNLEIVIPMDIEIQTYVSRIMTNQTYIFPDDEIECGIAVIENSTGHILALGGSRNLGLRNLNYATDVRIQPASTIKPILDYGPAIEYLGYSPLYNILDEPYYYSSGQLVRNWDNQYKGNITIRKALAESRNIPAIKLFKEVGFERSQKFASLIGINIDEAYHESMAIGGFEYGFSVLEMASAYSAFGNMGVYHSPLAITKIINGESQTNFTSDPVYAMKPSTAFLINNMLHDVFKSTKFDLKNQYFCAKTGQSNYPEDIKRKYNLPSNATKDAWTIGYTKDLTVACWVGYNTISKTNYINSSKNAIPRTIVHEILSRFSKVNKAEYMMPDNLVKKAVYLENGMIYNASLTSRYNTITDYFFLGFIPKNEFDDNISV